MAVRLLGAFISPLFYGENMELLSPAGNMQSAVAALCAGADAVYIGGSFSARAYAKNFNDLEIKQIIEYAHLLGRRIYAAVNTMLFDDELEEALKHVGYLYDLGVDAIIASDMGLIRMCKKLYPSLPIHISTQAGIHDVRGAALMKKIGAERVVPARETPLSVLKEIASSGIEVEAFCHGALCSGYSGACLMSSMIGARSGNRGKCAQPCRLLYSVDGKEDCYALSTADLCTIDHIEDFRAAQIASLKIEGRMKRPEYVACVTSEYRKAIDAKADKDAVFRLKEMFNRGGFTLGYFFGGRDVTYPLKQDHLGVKVGRVEKILAGGKALVSSNVELNKLDGLEFRGDALKSASLVIGFADKSAGGYIVPIPNGVKPGDEVWRTADARLIDEMKRLAENRPSLNARAELFISDSRVGRLALKAKNNKSKEIEAFVLIPTLEKAKNPLNEDKLVSQVKKTGGTDVFIENVELRVEGKPFISAAQLNAVRRSCVDALKAEIILSNRRYQAVHHKSNRAYEAVKDSLDEEYGSEKRKADEGYGVVQRGSNMECEAAKRKADEGYEAVQRGSSIGCEAAKHKADEGYGAVQRGSNIGCEAAKRKTDEGYEAVHSSGREYEAENYNPNRRYEEAKCDARAKAQKVFPNKVLIAASVTAPEQARAALEAGAKRVYVYADESCEHEQFYKIKKDFHSELYIVLTPYTTQEDEKRLREIARFYDGAVCSGWGEVELAKELFSKVRADFLMNIANTCAQEFLRENGVVGHTVSAEMNLAQLEMLGYPFEAIAYGHLPLISMRHCPLKKQGLCKKCKSAVLTDRKGYPMRFFRTGLKECQCVLLNSVLSAVSQTDIKKLIRAGAEALRLMFFYESAQDVYEVTKMYKNTVLGKEKITIKEEHNSLHLYRGV